MLHNIKFLNIKLQAHKEYGGVTFFCRCPTWDSVVKILYEQNIKISRKGLNYNKKQKHK